MKSVDTLGLYYYIEVISINFGHIYILLTHLDLYTHPMGMEICR